MWKAVISTLTTSKRSCPASVLHPDIPPRRTALPAVLANLTQQPAPLKIHIGMINRIQLRLTPRPLLLHPPDLPPVRPLKHPVARDVVPLPPHILPHPPQHLPLPHPHPRQQLNKIIRTERPVRTPVVLPRPRQRLRQQLLARVRTVPPATAIRVPAHVPIRVPHVVPVLLVELVVGLGPERGPPEQQALLEGEPDALEEQRVLQPREVLEVPVAPQRAVQVPHARREVRGQRVDAPRRDLRARQRPLATFSRVPRRARRGEVLR